MSTIVVARKGGFACIAADSLTTFGEIRLGHELDPNHSKIQTFGDTHIGIVGSAAHTLVAERAFVDKDVRADFSTRDTTFDTLLAAAPGPEGALLPEPEGERGGPLRGQPDGRGVREPERHLRAVFACARCTSTAASGPWAAAPRTRSAPCTRCGERHDSAEAIARAGAEAGAAFDTASQMPLNVEVVKLGGATSKPRAKRAGKRVGEGGRARGTLRVAQPRRTRFAEACNALTGTKPPVRDRANELCPMSKPPWAYVTLATCPREREGDPAAAARSPSREPVVGLPGSREWSRIS